MLEEIRYCECGCEQVVGRGNRFVNGHNRRNCTLSAYQKECISKANSGDGNATKRPEVAAKIAKALTGRKQSKETKEKRICALTNNPKIQMRGNNGGNRGPHTSEVGRQNMSKGAVRRILNGNNWYSNCKRGFVVLDRIGTTMFYRSSMEEKALRLMDKCWLVKSIEAESFYLTYVGPDGRIHRYVPDFLVGLVTGDFVIVEVKPKFLVSNPWQQLKFQSANRYAEKNGMEFQIWTEDTLKDENSVTTKLLEVTSMATAAIQNGLRDSLNHMVTCGGRQK